MAALPLAETDCSEDTRISRIKQVILEASRLPAVEARWLSQCILGLTLALAVCLCQGDAARAAPPRDDRTGTASLGIVPKDGRPRSIQLRAQTVDAVISQDSDGVWADLRIWAQLYNPGNTPIVVPVALPGPQLAARALPASFDITLDNKPLALEPLSAAADQAVIGFTAPITIPVEGSAHLRLRYRQALDTRDDLVTFTYPLTATAQWGGTPESLRVTIRFAGPLPVEAILSHSPAATRYERDGITWHMENRKAAASIGVAFMAPAWWAEFTAVRTAAAAPQAGLAEQTALSQRYEHLAGLPAPAFDATAPFFERYYPGAVAALQAGIAQPGAHTQPADLAAAHARLARLYLARAGRNGTDPGIAAQQAAAAELETAVTLDTGNAELRSSAADLYEQLAILAQARNDPVTADQHRARMAALRAAQAPATTQALAEAGVLVRATQAVEAGDLGLARRLIAETFGADAATLPGLAPPAATQIVAHVTTAATRRTIAVEWLADGESPALDALIADAAASLAPLAPVQTGSAALTITLTYADTAGLADTQARLADALPSAPELALLAAALRPALLSWQQKSEPLRISEYYVEQVNLQDARMAWEGMAKRLADAGRGAGASAGPSERLAAVQRALLAHDAAAWRALAEHSRVLYEVELNTGNEARRWEVSAGTARTLGASAAHIRLDRAAIVAGGAAILFALLLVALAWRR